MGKSRTLSKYPNEGVFEAPGDGKQYARKDSAWSEVVASGGSGGQVDSVVGGTDITVDNTDPINPIINYTGSGGGVEEAPEDGNAYARKDAGWVYTTEVLQTTTPTLSGGITVNENTELIVSIDNFSATATYTIVDTTCVTTNNNDGTLSVLANDVTEDTAGSIVVSAQESGEVLSETATHSFTVLFVAIIEGTAIVYDSASMTEFTELTDTQLADTDTTLEAIADGGFAISNVIDNAPDNIVGLISTTGANEPFEAQIEFANISTATEIDVVITPVHITDGDNLVIVKDDDSIVEYSNINGVSVANSNDISSPTMTSATTPANNKTFTNSEGSDKQSWQLYDSLHEANDCWLAQVSTGWNCLTLDTPITATKYSLRARNEGTLLTINPKTWTIEGSNDTTNGTDGTWDVLDTQTDASAWTQDEIREFEILNTTQYESYKINISLNQGNADYCGAGELSYYIKEYSYTLDPTIGEVPSKVYAVDAKSSFEIGSGNGYQEAVKSGDSYSYATDVLSTTRTYNNLEATTPATDMKTKMSFKAVGDKLTRLSATVNEEG